MAGLNDERGHRKFRRWENFFLKKVISDHDPWRHLYSLLHYAAFKTTASGCTSSVFSANAQFRYRHGKLFSVTYKPYYANHSNVKRRLRVQGQMKGPDPLVSKG